MPVFKIGLWNAWIFMVLYLLPVLFVLLCHTSTFRKTNSIAPLNKTEKMGFLFSKVTMFLLLIYSVFLPFKVEKPWFYIGLLIALFGLVMYFITWLNIVTSPPDELITKGLYRYSRHPMYVTQAFLFIGLGVATVSWLFLLLSVVFVILHFVNGTAEERLCLEAYGDTYREYVRSTPRWIGMPREKKE